MSRRGDNIRKRSDGRWEGRYISMRDTNGKAIYRSVYGKTYSEVKEKLTNMVTSIQSICECSNETVDEIAMCWLEDIKHYKKYSTYVKYENIYVRHIKQSFGSKKINDINEELCKAFIDSKRCCENSNSFKLSNSTLSSIKNVLTQIIKYGTDNENFRIGSERKVTYNKKLPETIQIFTKSEQQKMFDFLLDDVDNYKLGILVCLFTGLRLGEICALS